MDGQRAADRVQPFLGDLAEHDALRVADAQRDRRDALAVEIERHAAESAPGWPIAAQNV